MQAPSRHRLFGLALLTALTCFLTALEQNPETKEAVLALADAAWERQDWPRTEELCAKLTKIDPNNAHAWLGLGIAQAQQQKLSGAITAFERSLALDDSPQARYNLGVALDMNDQVEKAVPHLRRAVELRPDYGLAWRSLAWAQVGLGQLREARAAIQEALRLEPTNQDYDQVALVIEGMLAFEAQPKDAVDHANRGEQLALTGQNEEAAREYEAALGIAPNFPDCHYNLGRVVRRMGDFERAEREYRAAIAGYNADQRRLKADAQNNLADLLTERGVKTEEAVALVREAISVRGERNSYLDTLAKACDAQANMACAVEAYRKLLNSNKQLSPAVRQHAEERLRTLAPSQKP